MSENKRLSVVMISKNVADVIEACLDSVQWADEIIVLDSGATMQLANWPVKKGLKYLATPHGRGLVNSGN